MLGYDDAPTIRPSVRMVGLTVTGNLVYNINPQKWNDPVSGEWGLGRMFQILGGPKTVNITHNTVLGSTPNANLTLNSAVTLGAAGRHVSHRESRHPDNVVAEGEYGVIGDVVAPAPRCAHTYAPGWAFRDNLLVRGVSGANYPYPATTCSTRPARPSSMRASPSCRPSRRHRRATARPSGLI